MIFKPVIHNFSGVWVKLRCHVVIADIERQEVQDQIEEPAPTTSTHPKPTPSLAKDIQSNEQNVHKPKESHILKNRVQQGLKTLNTW